MHIVNPELLSKVSLYLNYNFALIAQHRIDIFKYFEFTRLIICSYLESAKNVY